MALGEIREDDPFWGDKEGFITEDLLNYGVEIQPQLEYDDITNKQIYRSASIAVDSAGSIYSAGQTETGRWDVGTNSVTLLGQSYSLDGGDSLHNNMPYIDIESDGQAVAVYTKIRDSLSNYRVEKIISYDRGVTWSNPVIVVSGIGNQIEILCSGNASWLVYVKLTDLKKITFHQLKGGSLSRTVAVTNEANLLSNVAAYFDLTITDDGVCIATVAHSHNNQSFFLVDSSGGSREHIDGGAGTSSWFTPQFMVFTDIDNGIMGYSVDTMHRIINGTVTKITGGGIDGVPDNGDYRWGFILIWINSLTKELMALSGDSYDYLYPPRVIKQSSILSNEYITVREDVTDANFKGARPNDGVYFNAGTEWRQRASYKLNGVIYHHLETYTDTSSGSDTIFVKVS